MMIELSERVNYPFNPSNLAGNFTSEGFKIVFYVISTELSFTTLDFLHGCYKVK